MAVEEESFESILKEVERLKSSSNAQFTFDISKSHDTLKKIQSIQEVQRKRQLDEERQREKNRRLQDQLDQQQQHGAEPEEEAQADVPDEPEHEQDPEPGTSERLRMCTAEEPQETDLSAVPDLPGPSYQENWLLLQQLLSTQQLITYTGPTQPVLELLFKLICQGEHPYSAYRTFIAHVRAAAAPTWVPQLDQFWAALQQLGYKAPGGSAGGGGHRKRPAAGSEGPAGDGGAMASGRLENLQCLLQLLDDLAQIQAQRDIGMLFNQQSQAKGKELFVALLRMQLDPDLSAAVLDRIQSCLLSLMAPWEDVIWRRIHDELAAQLPGLGPSYRAALRLIAYGLPGDASRTKMLQQCAALQLIRKLLGHTGNEGGGGSRRAAAGVDLQELVALMGQDAAGGAPAALVKKLTRASDSKTDNWRLMTVLQAMHLIVWSAAYGMDQDGTSGQLVHWCSTYMHNMETQNKNSRDPTVMRIRVLLAEWALLYESGCKPQDA